MTRELHSNRVFPPLKRTAEFDDLLLMSTSQNVPIIANFSASYGPQQCPGNGRWCPSCRTFTPVLESIVEEEEGRINVVRVEIDEGECAELATRYQVWSGEVGAGEADGRLRVFRRLLRFDGGLERWNSYRGID